MPIDKSNLQLARNILKSKKLATTKKERQLIAQEYWTEKSKKGFFVRDEYKPKDKRFENFNSNFEDEEVDVDLNHYKNETESEDKHDGT